MALLTDTKSRRKKSGAPSSESPSSSVPQSLPDSNTLKRIESLEQELAEMKANGDASKKEIEDLKAQLAQAKEAAQPKPEPQPQTVSKTDEREERNSFFGV